MAKRINIQNLNNKLESECFVSISKAVQNATFSDFLTQEFETSHQGQILTLKLDDYLSLMVREIGSTITLPATGKRAVQWALDYMAETGCTDMEMVGIYYFRIINRSIESTNEPKQ